MKLKERLRVQLGIGKAKGPNDPEDSDEEILNVLRRERQKKDGREELTTREISDGISIGQDQTHSRLEDLEDDDRVEMRRAGQTDMWRLGPQETGTVVNPELGPVIEWITRVRRGAVEVQFLGKGFAVVGFAFMLVAITVSISELTLPLGNWTELLALGYLFGVTGGAFLGAAGVFRILGLVTPALLERLLMD